LTSDKLCNFGYAIVLSATGVA